MHSRMGGWTRTGLVALALLGLAPTARGEPRVVEIEARRFQYTPSEVRLVKGEPPLKLDYGPPKGRVADYLRNESRFRTVERANPALYKSFVAESQAAAQRRYAVYQQLAGITVPVIQSAADEPAQPESKGE